MRRKIMLIFMVGVMLCLCACGKNSNDMEKYTGIYLGDTGRTMLALKEDGKAVYSENGLSEDMGIGLGTWEIKNNRIIVTVSNMHYSIYAEISDENRLLFTADEDTSWTDEVFVRY